MTRALRRRMGLWTGRNGVRYDLPSFCLWRKTERRWIEFWRLHSPVSPLVDKVYPLID